MSKRLIITVFCLTLCLVFGDACHLGIGRCTGADKRPKQRRMPQNPVEYEHTQYKKQNRDQITRIARGEALDAADYFKAYLANIPDDLESMFGLVVACAQVRDCDTAMTWLKKSVEAGLPFDRYLAGPRDLLAPLYDHPAFQEYARQRRVSLIHGPVLGSMTDSRARFWVRTVDETLVTIRVSEARDMNKFILTGSAKTSENDDFTTAVEMDGLKPNKRYCYAVAVGDKPIELSPAPSFQTFPPVGSNATFTVVFSGGAGYTPWNEHIWNTLAAAKPLAMIALGDNVYIDTPEVPQTQRYCYYRRQSRREYRAFAASTPIFAVWDDHDFGDNDCCNGPDFSEPGWKKDVLKVFTENYVNPYYGGGRTAPGVWFDFQLADVDFFLLDTRMYRDFPETKPRSMLGPVQKQWLKEKLKDSTAAFKVICSSLPWAQGAKPGSKDPWSGFPDEREELFSFIEKNQIDGVVLISADRHRSDAWKITRSAGYDLYEFMSSKLTNWATHGVKKEALFGYNEKCAFGRLTFDTTLADPQVTYTVVNIDGEEIHSLTLKKSQLTHK